MKLNIDILTMESNKCFLIIMMIDIFMENIIK